ncbi:MAG: N-acetylmuramoyl-L-alanine amidase [Raineya sp.]|jgi:hypothetical protein|nr:N-acetylmuramoyl-L-alanine amidase [Raineya sp.]
MLVVNKIHAQKALNKILAKYYAGISVEAFQKYAQDKKLYSGKIDGDFGLLSYAALYADLIKPVELQGFTDFIRAEFPKEQIVLHHSAGWDNARGMFDSWQKDGQRGVATAIGIIDNGTIVRGYNEVFWGHHIGSENWNNVALNQKSVAVEICNFGCLMKREGKYFAWPNNYGTKGPGVEIPESKVIKLNYKGFEFYEVYTDKEIESLEKWILVMSLRWNIDLTYRHQDMFPNTGQVSARALQGTNGMFTHNSFIDWKTDISPQPKMISMLEKLAQ